MDYINNQIMKQRKAEKRFIDLNSAMQQYFIVTGRQLEPLPPREVSFLLGGGLLEIFQVLEIFSDPLWYE